MKNRTGWLSVFGALLLFAAHGAAAQNADATALSNLNDALLAYQDHAADAAVANKAASLLNDPGTQVIGNLKGDVAIVEFFDYQCPYCKAIEPKLEKLMKDDRGVKLVIKEFPVLGPVSVVASKAALASVRQGKYEAYHKAMMAYRGQLKEENVFAMAKDVGLDVDRLRKDMDAPEVAGQIIDNMNLARALKISVTPALIVGNHIYAGLSARTESGKIDFEKAVAVARGNRAPSK
ncbi:MAG: DsbA family protein [Rhodospirillaceae bacterium]